MRILYIVNDLAYFRAHRENVALAMAKEGHDIFVASGDCQGVDISDWPSNITLLPLTLNKHTLAPKTDIGLVLNLRDILVEKKPGIVHAITIKPILMSALSASFFLPRRLRSEIKFVWTFAGLGKIFEATDRLKLRARKRLVVRALRYCSERINVDATFENSADRETIVEQQIISKNRTHVLWGTGLSMDEYKPNRSNRRNQPLVFLMATRLIREKGVDTYLKAAEEFSTHPAQPQFLLAGIQDPSNSDNVDLADIEAAESAGHIEFLGAVSGKNMPALYNRSDVMCLPTRLREGFPRSLLEAAACGCALIASDQEAVRQLIKQDKTGWLLPGTDASKLIQVIDATLETPEATRKTGQKTAEFVRNLPVSNENISGAFQQIYGICSSPNVYDNHDA